MKRLLTPFAVVGALIASHAKADCVLGKLAEIPVTMVGLRPLVSATINGAEVRFLADSGAFYSIITPGEAAELGLHLTPAPFNFYVRAIGGDTSVSIAKVKQFTLGKVTLPNAEFLVGGSEVGNDAAGVVGQNILGYRDTEYDLANGVIRLMRAENCSGSLLAYWVKSGQYSVMNIGETTARSPQVSGTASVNGVKVRVVFDTGAGASFLSLAAAKRAGIDVNGPGGVDAGLSGGFGRHTVRTWIVPVDSFNIGDEQIRHTRLRIGATELPDADMLIDPDFFLSHRVYVARSQHKLYFTYNGGPVFDLSRRPEATAAPAAAPSAPAAAQTGATDPTDAEGFSRRGAALAARGEFNQAIADFTHAHELAPAEERYFYQRAVARLRNRQPVLAMGDLTQALILKPGDADALTTRAELRLAAADRKDAIADLDAVSRLAAAEADRRLTLAELYVRADEFASAIDQFDLWIKAHPDDSRRSMALNGRCWARGMSGRDLEKALGDCDAALRMNAKSPAVLDSRGLVHLRLGDFDKAIADYDAALAQRPNGAWSLYGRGVAKLKKGMSAEGKADIAAATALQPKLPEEAKRRGIAP
ncbi:MAG TPA: aspartyl protease family protein [Caulobacteraceae bacterium]|nr:aspartyl protease family protein [Caulobacteraceae bacterium]